MRLLSPMQDFVDRTLSQIRGPFARFEYVAHMRDSSGHYRHWGLERSHGRKSAETVVKIVHQELLFEILQTPLNKLEVGGPQLPLEWDEGDRLLPADMPQSVRLHFHSVIFALRKLASAAQPGIANPPVA